MKRWKKISLFTLMIFILLAGLAYGALQYFTYHPSSKAQQALETTADIKVTETSDVIIFQNKKEESILPAIIFYQGALVKTESYSIWAEQLAQTGYTVYLCKEPFNLPILDIEFPQKLIKKYEIKDYVIGGHSLGGTAASRYAANHLEDQHLLGVFFLASYPDKKGAINASNLAVLSLTGSEDGVLNWDRYKKSKSFLPQTTIFNELEGGNHAGFGSYGEQRGDQPATISNQKQQEWIATQISSWMKNQINKKN